jgi:hypothetical protein
MAFGLPGMRDLADHIKSNIDTATVPSDQSENWGKFSDLLETDVDLESALHRVNFSQEMTNLIVQSAWVLINSIDEDVYKRSIIDRSIFPLGKLLKHMFRSSLTKINIITTNYDCLAEYACDQEELYYYSGFSHGHTKRLSSPTHVSCNRTVNIWKVHGSIDWFYSESNENISIARHQYKPDGYQPQIVTPGIQKYQKTHLEPFRTIIGSADKSLTDANSYFCFGFGFNDEHVQPKLISKCERDNASITIATYALTAQAKNLLFSGKINNFLAIERGGSDEKSIIYSSLHSDPIMVDTDFWSMSGFMNLII